VEVAGDTIIDALFILWHVSCSSIVMNNDLDVGAAAWSWKATRLPELRGGQQTDGLFQQYLDSNSDALLDSLTPDTIRLLAGNLISALDRASMHAMFFDVNDGQANASADLLSTDLFMTMRNSGTSSRPDGQATPVNPPAPLSAPVSAPATAMGGQAQMREEVVPPESAGEQYASIIASAAATHGLDPKLIAAVVQTESDFNAQAVSPVGAQGLMQLMPATAAELGVSDAFNPEQNIQAGSRYLKRLLDRYHGDTGLALTAYNWGMGNLERHPERIPQETINYVAKITGLMNKAV